jgi:hypothetical protein
MIAFITMMKQSNYKIFIIANFFKVIIAFFTSYNNHKNMLCIFHFSFLRTLDIFMKKKNSEYIH